MKNLPCPEYPEGFGARVHLEKWPNLRKGVKDIRRAVQEAGVMVLTVDEEQPFEIAFPNQDPVNATASLFPHYDIPPRKSLDRQKQWPDLTRALWTKPRKSKHGGRKAQTIFTPSGFFSAWIDRMMSKDNSALPFIEDERDADLWHLSRLDFLDKKARLPIPPKGIDCDANIAFSFALHHRILKTEGNRALLGRIISTALTDLEPVSLSVDWSGPETQHGAVVLFDQRRRPEGYLPLLHGRNNIAGDEGERAGVRSRNI